MEITSIILAVHNELNSTSACINNIRKFTPKGTYEIVMVDNASTDGTANWLTQQDDIKTIKMSNNEGFVPACNLALKHAVGTEYVIMHNDVLVGPGWLESMKNLLYSDQRVGAVGPLNNKAIYPVNAFQYYPVAVSNQENLIQIANAILRKNKNNFRATTFLYTYCLLIKKSVVEDIGLFDERFKKGLMEDIDFSFRMLKAGYTLLVDMEIFVYHNAYTTLAKTCSNINDLANYAQRLFKEKWGFAALYSLGVRYELINKMDLNKPDLSVLEIGCACGSTLLEILNRNCTAKVHGIELDEHSAAIAQAILGSAVKIMNVEKGNLPFNEQQFDYVLIGDVLEHLYDPWRIINELWRYLKVGGCLITSIPNVKHTSAVQNLFALDWKYEDAGILDRTHLRFFTKSEIEHIFTNSTYQKIEMSRNIYSFNKEFTDKLADINKTSTEDYNTLQWLVKAYK
ncbi:glycosyltransferase [Pectinatus cerevisiiphilus]|uniref:GT2 family glycosyltransferase n=1 Tax=Pectinatus cerevisiiphilus TaxID=86956 RepID=A0A4R3K9C1_9FIRM|nr:glycosyltransferase [Pectinatus cerevisiiphilus]TCS79624.1 GT2 family glycosyltransferase [Pectinatus cerevisiiphilus]